MTHILWIIISNYKRLTTDTQAETMAYQRAYQGAYQWECIDLHNPNNKFPPEIIILGVIFFLFYAYCDNQVREANAWF